MTITAKFCTTLVTLVAALGLCTATLAATAEARPKTPKPAKLTDGQCETLKILSNDMSKAAEQAYADGDDELGDELSAAADGYWAEAAKGGCRWATWRNRPSTGIEHVGQGEVGPTAEPTDPSAPAGSPVIGR